VQARDRSVRILPHLDSSPASYQEIMGCGLTGRRG
jgi:hypothetical protein